MHSYWEQLYRQRGPSMAAGVIAVARAMLSYAVIKEWIAINPAKELMIETPDPRVAIWGNAKIAAMIETADAIGDHSVGDAIFLALHSGQRLGDVLAIPPRILEEGRIALTQFKTDALVDAPMTPQLRVRFAEIRARWRAAGVAARATVVAEEPSGRPYPDRHRFGKAFRRVRAECASRHPELRAAGRFQPGLAELRFQDLRDTAVTRLALAGCSLIQISAITGHAPDHIATVIKHYLALDDAMADQAIALLTTWLTKEGVRV